MDANYAARYRALYEAHWWWRAREATLTRILERRFPVSGTPNRRILDIGSGDALFFPVLSRFGEPCGVEPDRNLVRPERIGAGEVRVERFLEDFESPNESFELITALDVLEHSPHDEAFVAKMATLLKPGALALVTVPALPWLWTHHDVINQHFRRYRRAELIGLFQRAGFHVDLCRYLFVWTVPVKLAIATVERLTSWQSGQDVIPRKTLNSALTRLSVLENRLGLLFPAPVGSSLVLVGRKSVSK